MTNIEWLGIIIGVMLVGFVFVALTYEGRGKRGDTTFGERMSALHNVVVVAELEAGKMATEEQRRHPPASHDAEQHQRIRYSIEGDHDSE